jgi:hypothetical protein
VRAPIRQAPHLITNIRLGWKECLFLRLWRIKKDFSMLTPGGFFSAVDLHQLLTFVLKSKCWLKRPSLTKYFALLSCRIFTHLATLHHLAMLQWLRAQTIAPPTPFPLWPLGHKKSRSLCGLPPLLIYQDIHWCLHQKTVYILYVLQISRV